MKPWVRCGKGGARISSVVVLLGPSLRVLFEGTLSTALGDMACGMGERVPAEPQSGGGSEVGGWEVKGVALLLMRSERERGRGQWIVIVRAVDGEACLGGRGGNRRSI